MPTQTLSNVIHRWVVRSLRRLFPDDPTIPDQAGAIVARYVTETVTATVRPLPDGTRFALTGDIPAMWLRDSSIQMWPLLRLSAVIDVRDLIVGVLRRQLTCIALDPYANAFNAEPSGAGHRTDRPPASPWVWERKYEIDSLCFPLDLAYRCWRTYGRREIFDQGYWGSVRRVVDTLITEQHHETRSAYRFLRPDEPGDSLARGGLGEPTAPTGLSWSGFRPSDDKCQYGYNVPGNMFAAVVLTQLLEILDTAHADPPGDVDTGGLRSDIIQLRDDIENGLRSHAMIDHPVHRRLWAYEVDGLGAVLLMDDANMPSLLSLPLLGYCKVNDPIYRATRQFVLSSDNPYFFDGPVLSGPGSPHTPTGAVWPLAVAVAALTSQSDRVRCEALRSLARTAGPDLRIHESVHSADAGRWTREWFAWAEAMFCELVLSLCDIRDVAAIPTAGTRR